jgi:hypothetical protein
VASLLVALAAVGMDRRGNGTGKEVDHDAGRARELVEGGR